MLHGLFASMRRLLVCLLLAPLVLSAGAPKVALVIGNGAYRNVPLKNPPADARAMAEQLRRLGFEVIERRDATREQMAFAIREFGDRLQGASTGVFYFAGHGVQVNGRNYLIPVDTVAEREDEVPYRSIDANEVLDKIDTARAPVNIVILDACRNNPFARSARGFATGGLASMDARSGSLIAFSTAPGSVAEDGTGLNGTYTKHLLRHIATPGMAVEHMFKRVRVDVAAETADRQIPWESSSLKADFSFNPAALRPVAADDSAVELAFWDAVKGSSSPADYRAYLEQYPQGRFAALARARAAVSLALAPTSSTASGSRPVMIEVNRPGPTASPAPPVPAAATAETTVDSVSQSSRVAALPDAKGWVVLNARGAVERISGDGSQHQRMAINALEGASDLRQMEVSPDGQWVALLLRKAQRQFVRLQPLVPGQPAAAVVDVSPDFEAMAWSVSGRDLLLAGAPGVVMLALERKTGTLALSPEPVLPPAPAGENIRDLRVSPDGRWLALLAISGDGPVLRVFDLASRRETWHTAALAVDFSPRVSAALVAGIDGRARLVEAASGRVLREMDSPELLLDGRYSALGDWLTTRDAAGRLSVWDTNSALAVDRLELGPVVAGNASFAVNDAASAVLLSTAAGLRVLPLRKAR